ncbi:MAG: hypothetical protein NWE83_05820 [Candidatus Bathyarchaeota archaeon]|jgi:hypothetical protein|nr:hypothetical protein [Candidatus Bathyarchaeota archaeon]
MALKDQLDHEGTWRLWNRVRKNHIVVEGKLEQVTDDYFIINGVRFSLTVWQVVGFRP